MKNNTIKNLIKRRLILLFIIYLIYVIKIFYDDFLLDDNEIDFKFNEIYHEAFFKKEFLFPKDIIIDLQLERCDISKQYISTIINTSYLRDERMLNQYQKRLKKAFKSCNMKKEEIFFDQIHKDKTINLTNQLIEKDQIENIVNYYYLIEHKSLLSEMKRMNYQSEDALLIIEKLEIDIAWEKRYDFKGQDEHFNRLVNKSIS